MKVVALLSGGIDSAVMVTQLLDEGHHVTALGIHYGQTHARELVHAQRVADELGVDFTYVTLPGLGALLPSALTSGEGSKVVPNRNTIFVSVAVGYALAHGHEVVAIGCNGEDAHDFPDCRSSYVDLLRTTVEAAGVQLWTPLTHMLKREVVALGFLLSAPIAMTRSCYLNGERVCGQCDACRDRTNALLSAVPG